MLFFGLLSIHGLVVLAKRYQVDPSLAVLLLCFSPAFFLGSQVVMLDVPMLSLLLLGLAYALTYQETGQKSAWGVAFAASFLCPLTKYNGLVIVPLLMLLLVDARRRIGISVLTTAPVCSFIFWNWFTWRKYGKFNILLLFDLQKNLEKSKVVLGHEMGILVAIGLGSISLAIPLLLFQVSHLRKSFTFGIPPVFRFFRSVGSISNPLFNGLCRLDRRGCQYRFHADRRSSKATLEESDFTKPEVDSSPGLVLLRHADAIWNCSLFGAIYPDHDTRRGPDHSHAPQSFRLPSDPGRAGFGSSLVRSNLAFHGNRRCRNCQWIQANCLASNCSLG